MNPSLEAGLTAWTVVNQAGSFGNWFAQTGTTSPVNGFPVPAPPDGTTAAMTDSNGAGSHVLLQSFTVPGPASSVILSFMLFRGNRAGMYTTATSLDYNVQFNQQARVDILTATASPFDVGAGVVRNVFQTNVGDPIVDTGYILYSFDITPQVGAGGTFQLRFAEVDNRLPFELGVDKVSVDFTSVSGLVYEYDFYAAGTNTVAARFFFNGLVRDVSPANTPINGFTGYISPTPASLNPCDLTSNSSAELDCRGPNPHSGIFYFVFDYGAFPSKLGPFTGSGYIAPDGTAPSIGTVPLLNGQVIQVSP